MNSLFDDQNENRHSMHELGIGAFVLGKRLLLSASKSDQEDMHIPADWRKAALVLLISCLAVLGLFWTTMRTMVEAWADSRTFAHGFFVLPGFLYLLWCSRKSVEGMVPRPSRSAFVLLAVSLISWLAGYHEHAVFAQQFAIITMIPGLFLATLGTGAARAFLFPFGFLVFALPFGTSVEPLFQDFTAAFVAKSLELTGIQIHRYEYLITLSSGTWEIASDCAGLRYLLPGLAVGYIYAGVTYRSWLRRLSFLLLCAALLIVANGLRAYGIILADHFGIAEGADHRFFSYTIYGITITSLFWLGLQWTDAGHDEETSRNTPENHQWVSVRETILMAVWSVAFLAIAPVSIWLLARHP